MNFLEILGLGSIISTGLLVAWAAVIGVGDWLQRRRGLGRIDKYAQGEWRRG